MFAYLMEYCCIHPQVSTTTFRIANLEAADMVVCMVEDVESARIFSLRVGVGVCTGIVCTLRFHAMLLH